MRGFWLWVQPIQTIMMVCVQKIHADQILTQLLGQKAGDLAEEWI